MGAPRIEFKLAESRQVHFAWFLLLDNDSQLALFTTFDGDFDAYLKHFALEVGTLFDKLFDCLADPPPLPVAQYPDEFVAKVKQYNRTPLGGYFFNSAFIDEADEPLGPFSWHMSPRRLRYPFGAIHFFSMRHAFACALSNVHLTCTLMRA